MMENIYYGSCKVIKQSISGNRLMCEKGFHVQRSSTTSTAELRSPAEVQLITAAWRMSSSESDSESAKFN